MIFFSTYNHSLTILKHFAGVEFEILQLWQFISYNGL